MKLRRLAFACPVLLFVLVPWSGCADQESRLIGDEGPWGSVAGAPSDASGGSDGNDSDSVSPEGTDIGARALDTRLRRFLRSFRPARRYRR